MAVEQPPALAVPLHGVGERAALGVSADRDQLVGAGAPGLGRGVPDSPAQPMPARRLAGSEFGKRYGCRLNAAVAQRVEDRWGVGRGGARRTTRVPFFTIRSPSTAVSAAASARNGGHPGRVHRDRMPQTIIGHLHPAVSQQCDLDRGQRNRLPPRPRRFRWAHQPKRRPWRGSALIRSTQCLRRAAVILPLLMASSTASSISVVRLRL